MEHPKEYSETGNISQRITEALDLTLSGLGYSTRVSWHMVKCLARETYRQGKSRTRNLWREKAQLRHCFSAIGIESLRFLILYDVIGFHCWVLRSYLTKLLTLLTLFSHSATLLCCNPDRPAEWLNDFGVRISWSLNLSLHLSPNPVLAIAATPTVACTAHNSICKVAEGGTVQEIKLQQICKNDWTKCVPKSENIHLTWECCSMLNHWMKIFNPRCAQIPW